MRKVLFSTESQTVDVTMTEEKAKKNESKTNKSKDYECFYCGTTIRNKIFMEYHRTNFHVKFDNIMHSFGKIKVDSKFSFKVCNKLFKTETDFKPYEALYHNPLEILVVGVGYKSKAEGMKEN